MKPNSPKVKYLSSPFSLLLFRLRFFLAFSSFSNSSSLKSELPMGSFTFFFDIVSPMHNIRCLRFSSHWFLISPVFPLYLIEEKPPILLSTESPLRLSFKSDKRNNRLKDGTALRVRATVSHPNTFIQDKNSF